MLDISYMAIILQHTNKTDPHDITKILLKVAVSNISFTDSATRHQNKTAFSTIKSLIGAANSSNTIQLILYSYVVTSWFEITALYLTISRHQLEI
jgi:hypothetical protein